MEIEVGDYVRFKRGEIRKITGIDEDGHFWINDYFRGAKWLNSFDVAEITKHSKNIIDLIEEGDFVNEEYVLMVREINGKKRLRVSYDKEAEEYGNAFTEEDEIRTILTHEQYEQICFRLEDN